MMMGLSRALLLVVASQCCVSASAGWSVAEVSQLLSTSPSAPGHASQRRAASSTSTQPWLYAELVLNATRSFSNPFVDVEVNATFSCVGQVSLVRPAFWDGASVWRVRFAPPAPGNWSWTSAASVADAGLLSSGVIEVAPPAAGGAAQPPPYLSHGFLRVSADGRRFEYADGTPFFWLGDTHWMMADFERLSECNAPAPVECSSAFDFLLADRAAKGFTLYQTYFLGQQSYWWRDANFSCIDPTRFASTLDVMMDRLASAGLYVALGVGLHEMSESMPPDSLRRLGAYAAARYGGHPALWMTAQEVNSPQADPAVWGLAAAAMAAGADARTHPLSAHMWPYESASNASEPTIYANETWHAWFMTQGGHTGIGVRPKSHYQFYWNFTANAATQGGAPVPFLESEAMYEGIICGPRYAFDNDTRAAAWTSVLSGSLGYTYGGAAVWLFRWNLTDPTGEKYNPESWWFTGSQLPASAQVGLLPRLLTSLAVPWTALVPRFSDAAWAAFADDAHTAMAADDGAGAFVVYAYGSGTALGSLRSLDAARAYSFVFVDPRTGDESVRTPVTPAGDGSWAMPDKPDEQDWLLVLTASSAVAAANGTNNGFATSAHTESFL